MPQRETAAAADADAAATPSCPYLDTIDRSVLDFDFEQSCSVSLQSGPHIYACLVCGKFFQGRGKQTPAYLHSVDVGHAVYVHLSRGSFHCLPDDYEISADSDDTLADIRRALHPTFPQEQIRALDSKDNTALARDLFGRRYLPGFVGLNNLNKTDYLNAVVQALAHVKPLRDFFLQAVPGASASTAALAAATSTLSSSRKNKKRRLARDPSDFSPLAQRFGELIRKIWSKHRFKANVDPHMFVQAVSVASHKRFHIGKQAEAGEFMAWLLHQLHIGVGGSARPKKQSHSSIVYQTFCGQVEVTTRQKKRKSVIVQDQDDRAGSEDEDDLRAKQEEKERLEAKSEYEDITTETNFLQLTLDIPEKPLFKDVDGGLVIPQEPLPSVLRKFDGTTFTDAINASGAMTKRRYRLKKLPDYLILHLARFKKSHSDSTMVITEKNPTIVAFPVKNLDLSRYVSLDGESDTKKDPPTEDEVRAMSIKELKELLARHGHGHLAENILEKSELNQLAVDFVSTKLPDLLAHKYTLVANITHHLPAEVGREGGQRDALGEGHYKCHVQHNATQQWYEIQDLHVEETMPQLIGVSESYVLIFERSSLTK